MKLVTTIQYYESDIEKREVLNKCLNSFEGQQEELIVLAGKQPTLPNAWNQSIRLAFSLGADFVIVSNDDVVLDKGNLKDLCIKGQVVSPTVNNGVYKVFHAHIWCMDKEVWDKVGEFDEKFNIYYSDTDYAMRLKRLGIPVSINPSVNVQHNDPGRTMKTYTNEVQSNDREYFIEKWGREFFDPITDPNV